MKDDYLGIAKSMKYEIALLSVILASFEYLTPYFHQDITSFALPLALLVCAWAGYKRAALGRGMRDSAVAGAVVFLLAIALAFLFAFIIVAGMVIFSSGTQESLKLQAEWMQFLGDPLYVLMIFAFLAVIIAIEGGLAGAVGAACSCIGNAIYGAIYKGKQQKGKKR